LIETQQNRRFLAEASSKLLSLVAASSVGSTWRRECLAQTVKVHFDRMTDTVLHQFDRSFSETCFRNSTKSSILCKVVDESAFFGCGKLGWVNMEKGMPSPNCVKVFFGGMTAILLHQFDGSFPEAHFETQQNRQFLAKGWSTKKLISSVVASSVGSTWSRECPAQTVKVFFDQKWSILLHQFDGSFLEMLFQT
jgi:hypothetical protein